MRKTISIIKNLFYILLLLLVFFSIYIRFEFNDVSFEQLIYTFMKSQGANYDAVAKGCIFIVIALIITGILVFIFFRIKDKIKINKRFKPTLFKKILFFVCFTIASLLISIKLLNVDVYIKAQTMSSTLFETLYVNPKDVQLVFPETKRNLIYIYVESLESSGLSKKNGGLVEESYTPFLEKLGLENINFSNNNKLGGAYQLNNTTWTMAGLVAHTSGIPLKLDIEYYNYYKGFGESLPGVYTLGDILLDNGYKNYFMMGSYANFGGREDYLKYHGNYEIYDYVYAKQDGFISDDYYIWWGYEDQKLFEYAKEKLNEISKNNEPFNFSLLTADTHFEDGYMDSSCEDKFDNLYANSFYCSDQKIYSFIEWLKEQDFYNNTTIIISGDHLTMQKNFFDLDNEKRNVYDIIMNSPINPLKEKNRIFSTLDMFPTTLAALGVEIKNNKLGLGVNLFSNEQTLLEKYGIRYINDEIIKKSFYYDNTILGDTYYKMKEDKQTRK